MLTSRALSLHGIPYPKNMASMPHMRWQGLTQSEKGNQMGVNTRSHLFHVLNHLLRGILCVLRWPGIRSHIRVSSFLPGRSLWNNTSKTRVHANTSYFNEECKSRGEWGFFLHWLPEDSLAFWRLPTLPTKFWIKSAPSYKRRLDRKRVGKGFAKKAHLSSFSVLQVCSLWTWPSRLWCPIGTGQVSSVMWCALASQITGLYTFPPERAWPDSDLAL